MNREFPNLEIDYFFKVFLHGEVNVQHFQELLNAAVK